MTFSTNRRKLFTVLMIFLIISSELVQLGEADKVFFKVLKAAKKLKKLKKWLPLLLLGPKVLIIKTGQSQSPSYQSDPCYSNDYSSQMSNYISSGGDSGYSGGSGNSNSGYSGNSGDSGSSSYSGYPASSGSSYPGRK